MVFVYLYEQYLKAVMMPITVMIAKHVRDVNFGGNWTSVNFRDTLKDVTWKQATTKLESFNTIATLVFHVNYYIGVMTQVLQGGPLEGKDELSFDHPPINSEDEWHAHLDKMWSDVESFATLIEQLPDSVLQENFSNEKYGTYYRNLQGFIEHAHYHLGQITLIKRMVQAA